MDDQYLYLRLKIKKSKTGLYVEPDKIVSNLIGERRSKNGKAKHKKSNR